jgi:hypothetical protein
VLSCDTYASNADLIAAVHALGYINRADDVLDPTFGAGSWWTTFKPDHLTTSDFALDGVDFRNLPHDDDTFDVVAFDPPYVCSRSTADSGVIDRFKSRYGLVSGPTNRHELVRLVGDGLAECLRVTRPRGFVLVKSQPFQNGKRDFVNMPAIVNRLAEQFGARVEDELIMKRPPGVSSASTFHHARSAHSVLTVVCKRAPIMERQTNPNPQQEATVRPVSDAP